MSIPVAQFTASKWSGKVPFTVTFTDLSENTPTSWSWLVEDANGDTYTTSSSQNPDITFSESGRFTVSLTATNGDGSNTVTKTEVIGASDLNFPIGGLAYDSGRKSYNYAVAQNPEQGYGWSEQQDGDWVWPDSPSDVGVIVDDNGYRLLVAKDSGDGLFYILNTRDAAVGSGYEKRWVDKYDPNLSSSGTEIPVTIRWPGRMGAMHHHTIRHSETNIQVEPETAENINASGYNSLGQRSSQQFQLRLYKDCDDQSVDIAEKSFPEGREIVFLKRVEGNSLQIELITTASEFKVGRCESYYIVYDRARYPSANSNDESLSSENHSENLSNLLFSLSRGSFGMGKDLVQQNEIVAVSASVTGPDGQSESAATYSSL